MVKKEDRKRFIHNRKKRIILIICIFIFLLLLSLVLLCLKGINQYSVDYQKIVDEFIADYYPGLSNRKIIVIEWDLFNGGSAFVPPLPFFSIIGVSTRVRDYSEESVRGLFAHELAHLDNNRHLSSFYFVGWIFSKKIRADYERSADEHAIEIGLGEFLLASVETDETLYSPEELEKRYIIKGYMSSEEIKKAIENRNSS